MPPLAACPLRPPSVRIQCKKIGWFVRVSSSVYPLCVLSLHNTPTYRCFRGVLSLQNTAAHGSKKNGSFVLVSSSPIEGGVQWRGGGVVTNRLSLRGRVPRQRVWRCSLYGGGLIHNAPTPCIVRNGLSLEGGIINEVVTNGLSLRGHVPRQRVWRYSLRNWRNIHTAHASCQHWCYVSLLPCMWERKGVWEGWDVLVVIGEYQRTVTWLLLVCSWKMYIVCTCKCICMNVMKHTPSKTRQLLRMIGVQWGDATCM